VRRLNAEVPRIMRSPEVQARLPVEGAGRLTRAPEQSHVLPGGPRLTRNYRRFRAACHLGAPGAGR
jgi:hypothetical protein